MLHYFFYGKRVSAYCCYFRKLFFNYRNIDLCDETNKQTNKRYQTIDDLLPTFSLLEIITSWTFRGGERVIEVWYPLLNILHPKAGQPYQEQVLLKIVSIFFNQFLIYKYIRIERLWLKPWTRGDCNCAKIAQYCSYRRTIVLTQRLEWRPYIFVLYTPFIIVYWLVKDF